MRLYSYGQKTHYLIDRMLIRETDRVHTTLRLQFYYPSFNFDSTEFRFTLDNVFRLAWRGKPGWKSKRLQRYYGLGGSIMGFGAAIEYAEVEMELDPQATTNSENSENHEVKRL